ncbi:hypothetical protein GCM10010277_68760 [Streptomyces longisporoflavus]|uniref:AAA family ATPase n=1 Tax=Streptomyces longisporoflavus TaxID=28044 RepID=UPI00167D5CB6|nr:AAA family ATPase [Streptomyces longisporoflavus]GGV62992.1 hypothetical protein GCM10010277_68760 [Streptomyces longisporoflavus]
MVAIDGYEDQPDGFDEAIAEQVGRITDWLADPGLGADRCFEVSRAPSVRTVDDLREFLRDENLAAARYQEAVVVYVTGHGLRRNAPRHFLSLPETEPDRLLATAYPTSELITAVVDSESEHVMVLVDSCFSGTLRAELSALLEALSDDRHSHHGIAVVTAGNHYVQPTVGSFTQRVALACERMRDEAAGYTASHLSFAEWEQLLDQVGRDEKGQEKDLVSAEWIVPHSRKHLLSACLPNPRYSSPEHSADPALRQLALAPATGLAAGTATDMASDPLTEFWLDRASGRAAEDDPGWYFSGRSEPMTRITGFLQGPAGVLIVTGAAGSGKSALLARLVTLSDPGFVSDPRHEAMVASIAPELRPAPGSVDAAVLARNKSAHVVVEDLLAALGDEDGTRAEADPGLLPLQVLIRLVSDRSDGPSGPVSVVIDALDEAEDPLALVNDVILPLAHLKVNGNGAVRLLLGVRSSPAMSYATSSPLHDERADQLLRRLTEALMIEGVEPQELRSDGVDSVSDIASYAATLLLAPEASPYRGTPEAAAEAGQAIAAAVAPSFLDARIAADQLRRAETCQDLTEEGWHDRLTDGTTGLLREDIRAVSLSIGVPAGLLVAVLRATAFAPGAGLPWAEVWPAVTAALVGNDYGDGYVSHDTADRAIRTLRSSRLTGYLATAEEDDRVVYRPVHQRLTDLLLADHDWLLAPPASTTPHWWPPSNGPQALAAAHAAIVEALANLVRRARPHLAHPYIRRHFLQHAAAGEVLTDRGVPLELLAQETSAALRARLGLPLPSTDPQRRTLTAAAIIEPYLDDQVDFTSRVGSVAFHAGAEDPPQDRTDRLPVATVWNRWTAPTNVLAPPVRHAIAACLVETLDGRSLIAVAGGRGGTRIWDATTGKRVADLGSRGYVRSLRPIRATGGRTFLLVLDATTVRVCDPATGQTIAAAMLPNGIEAHVLEDGFARWKVFLRTKDQAFLWRPTPRDARPGKLLEGSGWPSVASRLGRHATAVVRRASGHAQVAVVTPQGIRLWDPVTGLSSKPPFGGAQAAHPVAVARPEADDLLLVGNGETGRRLEAWDPFTGKQVAAPSRGHSPVALPGGRAFAYIMGSRILLRDLTTGTGRSFDADVPSVDVLAMPDDGPAQHLVSAGPQGVRLWDLVDAAESEDSLGTARYTAPWASGRRSKWPLCRISYPFPDGNAARAALVVGRPRGLDIHDATSGEPLGSLNLGRISAVQPLLSAPGTALVAVTGRDSWSVWDLVSQQPVATVPGGPLDQRPSCIAVTSTGLPVFVTVEARTRLRCGVWDPEEGEAVISTVDVDPKGGTVRWLAALPSPSPGGHEVVVAVAQQQCVSLIDISSGEHIDTLPLHASNTMVQSLCAFTAEGRILLAASTTSDIYVWDTTVGTLLASWAFPDTLTLTALDLPDGRTLLASGDASGVRIWDPRTGSLRHTLLTGAPVPALATGTSPMGTALHLYGAAGLATVAVDERQL